MTMRKLALLLAFMAGIATLQAQNSIPNGDLELWYYGKPVGWSPGLHGYITSFVNIPIEVNFCSQSPEAHGGNYAVKLQSADFSIPYGDYSLNLPGILQLGESDGFTIAMEDIMAIIQSLQDTTGSSQFDPSNLENFSSLLKLISPGIPCNSTPAAISLWAKYQAQDGDEMVVLALTKKNGVPVDYTYDTYSGLDPDTYEKLHLSFENPGAECDSIMIIILSSTQLNSSSVLYVDDVAIVQNGTSVGTHSTQPVAIYPNPVSDMLFLESDRNQPYQWTLRDLTGRTLKTGKGQGKLSIDTKNYPSGIYMITVNTDGMETTRKVIIR